MQKTVVIALGGNAMQQPGQKGTYETQLRNVQIACDEIYRVRQAGFKIILTSGNGPQVGAIQLQNQIAVDSAPEMPLFCCGAMSQGLIGYWMQQCMGNVLRRHGEEALVATCLTQSIVDAADPAFSAPTKPVGKFYTKEEALLIKDKIVKEDAGRGWRVVVPSPRPVSIVEYKIIKNLIESGVIVICTNGGGVPVLVKENQLEGVDAVIDKDLATSLLARQLGADYLVILTDVSNACLNYKQENQQDIEQIQLDKIKQFEKEGHFKAGSMGPKVRAAVEFVQETGNTAIITSLDQALNALLGKCGTRITK